MARKKQPSAKVMAVMKYQHDNTKLYGVRVGKKTEADIIAKLDSVDNKQGYIKRLIREDIAKNGF